MDSPSRRLQKRLQNAVVNTEAPRYAQQVNTAAASPLFSLHVDEAFEFKGSSGFGKTLPTNKPLQAISPNKLPNRSGSPQIQQRTESGQQDLPSFSFTNARKYISPTKIPVLPGTLHSPIKPTNHGGQTLSLRDNASSKSLQNSPKSTSRTSNLQNLLSNKIENKYASTSAKCTIDLIQPTALPQLHAGQSPRKFLRDMLDMSQPSTVVAPSSANKETTMFAKAYDPSTNSIDRATADHEAATAACTASSFLHTGEDAIAFFARVDTDSDIKFVHLNRAESGIYFRPYDLIVVPPESIGREYFTMSSTGLVHISPGSPSEFIPLAEWMRESSCFNVISSIHFFKNYLIRKTFSLWCATVRYKLYQHQRQRIKQRLYFVKETFCVPLLNVKKIMNSEVLGVVLLDLRAQKTYEISSFVDYQSTKRADGSKQFELCVEKLQTIIHRVCLDVKNLEMQATFPKDELRQGLDVDTFHQQKSKSIVAAKSEQKQRRQLYYRAKNETTMILDFVRLIDYIAVECLVSLAVQTCGEFLQELNKSPRKTGLFETTIHFGENLNTILTPTSEQIQQIVVNITDDIVSAVNAVSRVLFLQPLAAQVSSIISDPPNIGVIISKNCSFQHIRQDLILKVQQDYSEAVEYVKIFDIVRPIFEFDKQWNFDEYGTRTHTVSTLKADMMQISMWEKELEKMRAGQTIGILHVESRKLKQALIPMTTVKLDVMKGLVKDLARSKCRTQLNEYKQRIATFQQRPQQLKEFSIHLERIGAMRGKQKSLAKNTNVVDELYRLLQTYGVRIASEDMVQLDDLRGVQELYKEESDAVDAFIASKIGDMTQQLESNVQRLEEQVQQVNAQLQTGIFIDPSYYGDPELVLTELDAVKQRLGQLEEQAKQYVEIQVLFNLPTSKFLTLATTQEYFGIVESLWNSIAKWNEAAHKAMTHSFVDIQVEDFAKDANTAYTDAFSFHKKLSNEVTAVFKEQISEFKNRIPTILELGNPAMRDRHWEQIFKALRQPWYPGLVFTLENLISYDVLQIKDKIEEISAIASGEAQTENSPLKIKNVSDLQ